MYLHLYEQVVNTLGLLSLSFDYIDKRECAVSAGSKPEGDNWAISSKKFQ